MCSYDNELDSRRFISPSFGAAVTTRAPSYSYTDRELQTALLLQTLIRESRVQFSAYELLLRVRL